MFPKTTLDPIINGNLPSAVLRICTKRLDNNIAVIPQCEIPMILSEGVCQ